MVQQFILLFSYKYSKKHLQNLSKYYFLPFLNVRMWKINIKDIPVRIFDIFGRMKL